MPLRSTPSRSRRWFGAIDAATGQARAGIGAPVTSQFSLYQPSMTHRVVWVLVQPLGPMLAFAGLWLVRGIVRSTEDGHPFTVDNERRLWQLAVLVAIGAAAIDNTMLVQIAALATMALGESPGAIEMVGIAIVSGVRCRLDADRGWTALDVADWTEQYRPIWEDRFDRFADDIHHVQSGAVGRRHAADDPTTEQSTARQQGETA